MQDKRVGVHFDPRQPVQKSHAEQCLVKFALFGYGAANIAHRDVSDGDAAKLDGGDLGRSVGGAHFMGEIGGSQIDAARWASS